MPASLRQHSHTGSSASSVQRQLDALRVDSYTGVGGQALNTRSASWDLRPAGDRGFSREEQRASLEATHAAADEDDDDIDYMTEDEDEVEGEGRYGDGRERGASGDEASEDGLQHTIHQAMREARWAPALPHVLLAHLADAA